MTSVGWVFESVKTASSGLLSIAESKNCQFINSHSFIGFIHQGEITGWYRVDLIQILRIVHLVLLWTVSTFPSQPLQTIATFCILTVAGLNCPEGDELFTKWATCLDWQENQRQGAKHPSRDFVGVSVQSCASSAWFYYAMSCLVIFLKLNFVFGRCGFFIERSKRLK